MKKTINISMITLLISLPIAIVAGCAAPTPSPTSAVVPEQPVPAHFITYTEENVFSISYPPDWETAMSSIPGLKESTEEFLKDVEFDVPLEDYSMIFFGGCPFGEEYIPNVNIVVGPAVGSTLAEEFEAQMRGVKPNVENYQQYGQIKAVVGGREVIICDHEFTVPGMGRTHCVQMLILEDGFSWTVTCGTPPEHFSDNQEIINQVVRSFRILK